jgi:hypothetical protein
MRYVVQVKAGDEWIDYVDRFGDKREYEDPAVGHGWIQGAGTLPGAAEYRLYDTDSPQNVTEAILKMLSDHGPMTDPEIYRMAQTKADRWGEICAMSEQRFRTLRSRLVKAGKVRAIRRVPTPRGRTAAVWGLVNGKEEG